MTQKKLSDLPERLSIVFPIWGLLDMNDGGVYHDLDRMMREIAERGFNCVRFEDGAGLIDFSGGRVNGKVPISEPFPGFSSGIRQTWNFGGNGECGLAARLLEACKAAKKYGIKLALSSWYYLHTYWYCHDEEKNRAMQRLRAENVLRAGRSRLVAQQGPSCRAQRHVSQTVLTPGRTFH